MLNHTILQKAQKSKYVTVDANESTRIKTAYHGMRQQCPGSVPARCAFSINA